MMMMGFSPLIFHAIFTWFIAECTSGHAQDVVIEILDGSTLGLDIPNWTKSFLKFLRIRKLRFCSSQWVCIWELRSILSLGIHTGIPDEHNN